MEELVYAVLVLAIVFMWGIVVGIDLVKRRPASLDEKLGALVRQRIESVYAQRKWVGRGLEISNTIEIDVPDNRKIELVVREGA